MELTFHKTIDIACPFNMLVGVTTNILVAHCTNNK